MTNRRMFAALSLCVAFAFVSVIAYRVGRARADGAPTMEPLTYGGVVDDGGRPMEGTHSVTVRLWDMPIGGTAACTTVSPTTPFVAGRFRVTMDAMCTAAVQANPNLWAEVIVDSTTLPRSRVGAVPYAIEAARASGASGALATRILAVESASRPRQVEVGALGSSSSSCAASWQTSNAVNSVTMTAAATGIYRVSALLYVTNSGAGGTAYFRVASASSATFAAQPEVRVQPSMSSSSSGVTVNVLALARLEAGRAYTFSIERQTPSAGAACGFSDNGISPLVVEQLN